MKIVVEEKLISDDLTKFWELENLGIEANATENISDDVTLKEFESGISFSDNRYSVRLPWKPGMKEHLQDNRTVALKRFRGLQSKFLNDPFLFNEYRAVLEEYKSENIIESVTNELKEDKTIFYLPHTAVIREDKTKIKFRENRVAFTADIKQAFLQIQLDEEDRDVTRFLWNENPYGPEELIQSYRMTRVLFGTVVLGFGLDEFFPKNLEFSWNEWCEEVPELNTFSIPRYYLGYALQNEIDNIQIHCFSDSSKKKLMVQ
ncbi:integrase catalytic domain-containing protein [Trichonephila clavipes]|nr:integrase catalytic domain-containing protein [Trichonephila clavipes]